MIGFGIGVGSLGFEDGDSRESSAAGNFRIGYAVRPEFVIHLESTAWTKTFDDEFLGRANDGVTSVYGDITLNSSSAVAALTYYPPQSGFFLRGGLGLGRVEVEVKTGGLKVSEDEKGLALLLAIGHESRVRKRFALGPELRYTYQALDTLSSSTLMALGLGFNWYW